MAKKVSDTPANLARYTMQVDKELYMRMKSAAVMHGLKTYQLMNTILLLGCKEYTKRQTVNKYKIDTKATKNLQKLYEIVSEVVKL